jgi:hypothetical protein
MILDVSHTAIRLGAFILRLVAAILAAQITTTSSQSPDVQVLR